MKKSIMAEMASAPPPPPPLSKGSRKTLIAVIVIVIIAIAAVAAGVYLATQSGGGGGGGGGGVAGASSLQFSISVTSGGVSQGTYTYMAKNVGTSSMMIRIEITSTEGNVIYIVNGAQQKAWGYSDDEWQDLSDTFSTQWNSWNSTWVGYTNNLADWTGVGDWTYTDPNGDTVRIYDVAVNPSLADSLFQP